VKRAFIDRQTSPSNFELLREEGKFDAEVGPMRQYHDLLERILADGPHIKAEVAV